MSCTQTASCEPGDHTFTWPCEYAPGTGERVTCALQMAPGGRCSEPAIYEMDIDGDEEWIPLCIAHGPTYRRSSNVRIRTLRTAAADRENRTGEGNRDE